MSPSRSSRDSSTLLSNQFIDPVLPQKQAGFRHWRSTIDHITSLTQDIDDRSLAKNKVRAVFVNLTAACKFVCSRGLTWKLLRVLADRNTFRMIMELISIRSFTLTTGLECWVNNVVNSHSALVHSTVEYSLLPGPAVLTPGS